MRWGLSDHAVLALVVAVFSVVLAILHRLSGRRRRKAARERGDRPPPEVHTASLRSLLEAASESRTPLGRTMPQESRVRYAYTRNVHIFRIPNSIADIAIVAFLTFCLFFWTMGIIAVSVMLLMLLLGKTIGESGPSAVIILVVWLAFALYGEVAALAALFYSLAAVFGGRYLLVSENGMAIVHRLAFISSRMRFDTHEITHVRAGDAGLEIAAGRRPYIVRGVSKIDAQWMADVLNTVLILPDARAVGEPHAPAS